MSNRVYYSHTAEEQIERRQRFLVMVCLLVGAGIGAAVTTLFMPNEKRSIRDQIVDMIESRIHQLREELTSTIHEGNKAAQNAAQSGIHKVGHEYSHLREVASEKIR